MRRLNVLALMAATTGLAATVLAETEAEAHQRLKLQQPRIDGEWARKPAPTPKKGRPTKAEKKAAKRARTRGVAGTEAPSNQQIIDMAVPYSVRLDYGRFFLRHEHLVNFARELLRAHGVAPSHGRQR